MAYEVTYHHSAAKSLRSIKRADSKLAKRILDAIEALAGIPDQTAPSPSQAATAGASASAATA